jgi:hypothetical protein
VLLSNSSGSSFAWNGVNKLESPPPLRPPCRGGRAALYFSADTEDDFFRAR